MIAEYSVKFTINTDTVSTVSQQRMNENVVCTRSEEQELVLHTTEQSAFIINTIASLRGEYVMGNSNVEYYILNS